MKFFWINFIQLPSAMKKQEPLLALLLLLIVDTLALRDVRVVVPAAVRRGESAALRCLYDIEHDQLYSVKWYRAEKEFYRYMPKEKPVMKHFPLPGVVVSKKQSNASVVTLESVDSGTAGRYSCEVSADSPSFHTFMVGGTMDVVDVPLHPPVITGVKPRYRTGSVLRGNCTCKHSRPAANLTWYINGQQANPSYTKRYKSHEFINPAGLHTAVVGIHFVIGPQHFHTGKLKLRCTASMYYDVYWKSTEKSIEEEKIRSPSSSSNGGLGGPGGVGGNGGVPESQHVAIMYPVQGTAYDPDPPPSVRDALGGVSSTGCSHQSAPTSLARAFLLLAVLRHLLMVVLCSVR